MLMNIISQIKQYYQHEPHSLLDDLQGVIIGTILLSLGIYIVKSAGLFVGGLAGVTLLFDYISNLNFSIIFFTINIPFYIKGYYRFKTLFVIKTLLCVTFMSILVALFPMWFDLKYVNVYAAAIVGEVCLGITVLALFRHRSSAGGVNVFVLYLQDRFNLNVGISQMIIDALIVFTAIIYLPISLIILSVLCGIITNSCIAINHRKGRYISY